MGRKKLLGDTHYLFSLLQLFGSTASTKCTRQMTQVRSLNRSGGGHSQAASPPPRAGLASAPSQVIIS
jgi:hypothetical protein